MLNWRQGTKNKRSSCTPCWYCKRRFWFFMQYSLNKDLQHLKRQQLKSWISSPDCRVAMDKQQTQYQLLPKYKWKMFTNYCKFQIWSVQTFGFVCHDTNDLNHGPVLKTQSFLLKRICMVILWQGYYGKGMSLCSSWKRIILICACGWQNWLEKNNLDPMWKVLNKEVDLGEPTSFLDHVYLGCTQRKCEISNDVEDNYRTMFESRISAGGLEKLPFRQNICISSWSYDMAGHAKNCVERYCELANKTTRQLYKVSTPCIDDHHVKEEKINLLGNCHMFALLLFWNVYTWREMDDLICYGQQISFARSITKWTKARDKRLNRLISYIRHTCDYNSVLLVILLNNTDWDCFRTLVLREILKIQNPLLEEHCAFLEVIHLFQ